MNYPEFVKIDDKKYEINTDFRVAIECNEIALDNEINDFERALAIIYKLFGDKGLNDVDNYIKLLELAKKYLSCNKELENSDDEELDMDYLQDMDYIEASFMSDYNIDLPQTKMHWWKFYNLLNGLSNSEMGNCCVLNRVRNLRNLEEKDIENPNELAKIRKAKQQVALKRKIVKQEFTKEQKQNSDDFYKMTGIKRKE